MSGIPGSSLFCALWTGTACFLGSGFTEVAIPPVNLLQLPAAISVRHENQPRGYSGTCLEGVERV